MRLGGVSAERNALKNEIEEDEDDSSVEGFEIETAFRSRPSQDDIDDGFQDDDSVDVSVRTPERSFGALMRSIVEADVVGPKIPAS